MNSLEPLTDSYPLDPYSPKDEYSEADESLLRLIVDSSPSMLAYWDANLCNRFANPAYANWFGVDPRRLRGRHIRELLGEELYEKNLPFLHAALRGEAQSFERDIPTSSGTRSSLARYQPHVVEGRTIGILVEVTDISALKCVEAGLRQENLVRAQIQDRLEALLREQNAMLNNDMVGMLKVHKRKIVWANQAYDRIFGYASTELLGHSTRLLHRDLESYIKHGQDAYSVLREHGTYRTQVQMRRKSGELFWADVSGAMLSPESEESLWLMLDISSLKAREAQIENIAFSDALTGLVNRGGFEKILDQLTATQRTPGDSLAVCFIDLDGFKLINDNHGHEAGDMALQAIAARLRHGVRAFDTVARMGGDEFIIILPQLPSHEMMQSMLNRLVETIRQPIAICGGQLVSISTSIGVALFPDHASTAGDLIRCADDAMYAAKAQGGNTWHWFSQT